MAKKSYSFLEIGKSIVSWDAVTEKDSLPIFLETAQYKLLSFVVLCHIAIL